jgi:hypothetical protein
MPARRSRRRSTQHPGSVRAPGGGHHPPPRRRRTVHHHSPVRSENPSLDAGLWRFWRDSFTEFQVPFDDQDRVREVSTDPLTRNLVVKESLGPARPAAGPRRLAR